MPTRPCLRTPKLSVDEYIEFWGSEHYMDFCDELGVTPLPYWTWVARTKQKGVDWWLRELQLEQITRLPSVHDYRMLVRAAHPDEADGPRRLFHYVQLRAKKKRLSGLALRYLVLDELGGRGDPEWLEAVLKALDGL